MTSPGYCKITERGTEFIQLGFAVRAKITDRDLFNLCFKFNKFQHIINILFTGDPDSYWPDLSIPVCRPEAVFYLCSKVAVLYKGFRLVAEIKSYSEGLRDDGQPEDGFLFLNHLE
jgi:hypothetical protein